MRRNRNPPYTIGDARRLSLAALTQTDNIKIEIKLLKLRLEALENKNDQRRDIRIY